MRVVVIGAGAIGCWVGATAVQHGAQVMFISRPAFAHRLPMQGLVVHLPDGNVWTLRTPLATTALTQEIVANADVIFICTKSYDIPEVIQELKQFTLNARTFITCFQNGVGSEEQLAQAFNSYRVLSATVTSPVSINGHAEIKVGGFRCGIGLAALDKKAWASEQKRAFANVRKLLAAVVYEDYQTMKWSKLLLNTVGNATSAILDMPLDDMYANSKLLDLEFDMLREGLAVMKRLEIEVMDLPRMPARRLASALNHSPNFLLRPLLKGRLIKGRGGKKPSFGVDLANGKGRSEVMYLNGQIMAWGRELEIPTPINTALTNILLDLVEGVDTVESWRGKPERLLAACQFANPTTTTEPDKSDLANPSTEQTENQLNPIDLAEKEENEFE